MTVVLILIAAALICCVLSGNLAKMKGHNRPDWALCGFFFGILGLDCRSRAAGPLRKGAPEGARDT